MIIAPLLYDSKIMCLYRDTGQEVLFTIKNGQINKITDCQFTIQEIQHLYDTYINESRNKNQQRHANSY